MHSAGHLEQGPTIGNTLLIFVVVPLTEYHGPEPDDIGAFLNSDPVGIGHPHREVFHLNVAHCLPEMPRLAR